MNGIKKIISFLIVIIFLTSCSSTDNTAKGSKSAGTAQSSKAPSDESAAEEDANIKSLTSLISMDTDMVDGPSIYNITIIPPKELNSLKYFVIIEHGLNWLDSLWSVTFDGGKIINKKEINYSEGSASITKIEKYELIQITQGEYLQLYFSVNMGMGNTALLNTKTLTVDFTFETTVDRHQEGCVGDSIVKKLHLPAIINDERNYGYSFVYYGDYLTSYYTDINKDGKTDAVFYGYEDLVSDDYDTDLGHTLPLHVYYIKRVYIFDSLKNEFVFNKLMSSKELIR